MTIDGAIGDRFRIVEAQLQDAHADHLLRLRASVSGRRSEEAQVAAAALRGALATIDRELRDAERLLDGVAKPGARAELLRLKAERDTLRAQAAPALMSAPARAADVPMLDGWIPRWSSQTPDDEPAPQPERAAAASDRDHEDDENPTTIDDVSAPRSPERDPGGRIQLLASGQINPGIDIYETAQTGVAGAGARLPHLAVIQRSFGDHDVSDIEAHVGGATAMAARAIGAEAYAAGNKVAFASEPSLFIAAHEAAHVVQQRAGVHLASGVGEVGDAYEQHADAVAERVVRGELAEPLLAGLTPAAHGSEVQRKEPAGPQLDPFPPAYAFTPDSLTFKDVGEAQEVTVTNTTDGDLTWDHVLDGDPVFQILGLSRGAVIRSGGSLRFVIRYRPSLAGSFHAEVVASRTTMLDWQTPARLALRGTTPEPRGTPCGTAIEATSPGGNPNSIESAMASVANEWEALLKERIDGIGLIQALARNTDPPSPPSMWEDVLQGAIQLGLIGVSRLIAAQIAKHLSTTVIRAEFRKNTSWETSGPPREANELADEAHRISLGMASWAIAVDEKAHDIVTGQVVDTLQAQSAAAIKTGVANAKAQTGGSGAAALARESFFEAMKSDLNLAITDLRTAFNNSQGDYAELEAKSPGFGFAALEAYRNTIACHAPLAKELQSQRALGGWAAFLAKSDAGAFGDGKDAATDLHGPGGIATPKGDDFARGILVLDMAWADMTIKRARVRGLNAELRAMLAGAPLRRFSIPFLAIGNVRGTDGKVSAGEVRVGRDERGEVAHAIAEDGGTGPGHKFMKIVADGNVDGEHLGRTFTEGPDATESERERAAADIAKRIARMTLGEVEEG